MKRQFRNSRGLVRSMSVALVILALFSSLLSFIDLLPAPSPARAEASTIITITPDQMTLSGDVATQGNTLGQCTETWLSSMPSGSIILGVDPASCDPKDWEGASASMVVSLPNVYASTTYVLKISWPDVDGKGLHSPVKNQTAFIDFDAHSVWSKRTLDVSNFGDYYGAQHEPIVTTLVVTATGSHTLRFNVPAQTAWDLSQIELTAYPTPTKIHGIGYSPYRDCQYPGGAIQPSVQDVQEDFARIIHFSNAIRTYSSTGINAQVPAVANALGMPVFPGAWLDNNSQDEVEIQELIALAKTYHLDGVIVGNEYYLRNRTNDDLVKLKNNIIRVKNNIPSGIPVTTAEIDTLMFNWTIENIPSINENYRPILNQVDMVMVHIYPFWSGLPIDGAADYTIKRYLAMQSLLEREYPGQHKRIIIGEAGWPSAGGPQAQAVPSLQNQRRYMLEFLNLAEQQGVEYFYFDGFDELWKIEEPEHVGQHWGFGYTDRSAKHSFYGVLLPAAQLPSSSVTRANNSQSEAFQEIPDKGNNPADNPQMQPQDVRLAAAASPGVFTVYDEWPEGPGHFVPSGWMGDITKIGMYACERSDPYEGEMAVRASFSPGGSLGWGGVYWQYPENNWGNLNNGINLTGMNKITFWAKGEKGNEKIKFTAGGIGAENDPYPESLRPEVSTSYITLTNSWQQYSINLSGKDLSHVIGGFGWATDRCASPQGATFFLDKIQYEYDPNLIPPPSWGGMFPIYTDASDPDNHYFPSGWMGDAKIPGQVSLTECWLDNPHSGNSSIRVDYPILGPSGWAAVYWLQSSENWGDRPGGVDLTGVESLTFWARTDTPGTPVTFLIGGVGYASDNLGNAICSQPLHNYPDSVCPKIQQTMILNAAWTKYTIDLKNLPIDFSRVVGGFGWLAKQPVTFYLDDILYETPPSITSSVLANPNPTTSASVDFIVTFSEPVTGVDLAAPFNDFTLATSSGISGASITGVSGTGMTYTVTVNTGSGSGTIRLDVPATATITDLVGNPLSGLPFIAGKSYAVRSVNVYIGGALKGSYFLTPSQSTRQNYAAVDSGPVKVVSSNGVPIISAIRSAWAVNGVTTSFSQLMGLPLEQLSDTYVFPGYNNVSLNDQLRIANVDTISSTVTVTIGGIVRGTYPLAAGAAVRINYPGLDSGPVVVKGTSGVKIISSIREAWAVNGVTKSFVQLMGLPAGQLSNKYVFPAYNNVTLNEQLRIGNVDTVATSVTVTIGGTLRGTYPLGPGQAVRINYPGLDSGPVVVEGTAGVNIISSIRSAWAVNGVTTSFSQLMGIPAGQLSDKYLFPGYNNVTLNDQLRISNVDTVPTTVTVTIGGTLRGTYPLAAGAAVRINYAGLDSGPVVVQGTSGVKIISSIREAWAVNGVTQSFVQLMGLPAGQLSATYLFPAYNNVTLNEQLRIGMP